MVIRILFGQRCHFLLQKTKFNAFVVTVTYRRKLNVLSILNSMTLIAELAYLLPIGISFCRPLFSIISFVLFLQILFHCSPPFKP